MGRAIGRPYNGPMKLRRPSDEPRFEMTPLLDVIFLLLTFFIMLQPQMIRAALLSVSLPQLTTAAPADASPMLAITLDGEGRLYLNREPIDRAELRRRLAAAAEQSDAPRVYLAADSEAGRVDRLPIVWELIDLLRSVGIEDFTLVGAPQPDRSP